MLTEILSRKSCAECKVCCGFERDDAWEMPVISRELAEYIKQNIDANARLEPYLEDYKFKTDFKDGEELFMCPMLRENGCVLGNDKPFDCRIWPFRAMRIKDNLIGITVSPVCKTVSALPLCKLSEFLLNGEERLADIIISYAKEHNDIIKPYIDNYPVLKLFEL